MSKYIQEAKHDGIGAGRPERAGARVSSSTPIADMITEMLKNCIPMEMIIVAVRSMERAVSTRHGVDKTAEKRRAWDREYRRAKRGHPLDPPDIHPKTPDVGNDALSSLKEDKKH